MKIMEETKLKCENNMENMEVTQFEMWNDMENTVERQVE
jgi:hypothetical protein